MATAAQAVVVHQCDLCEHRDSRWLCSDCQIKLCDKCKKVHQRGPKTKNDNIIPIGQVHRESQGKTVPVLCDTHKTKICELYCVTCERLICAECSISSNHKSHSFHNIETLINTEVSKLNNIEENFKSKLLTNDRILTNESKQHADYMTHIEHLEYEVKEQTDKIVKEFYRLRDKQISELLTLQKEEERRYSSKCNLCQSRLTDVKKVIESVQKSKVSGNVATMLRVRKEATQSYKSLEDLTMSDLLRPEFERCENPEMPLFIQLQGNLNVPVKGVENKSDLQACVPQTSIVHPNCAVDMNNVKVKLRIKIKGKTGIVRAVIPTANNMAWIALQPNKYLSLIDAKGTVVKKSVKLDDEIYHAVPYDDDILVKHATSHCVMRLNKGGDSVTTFANLSPFYPRGLCVTSQQDVIVCLLTSLTNSSASKLVRLNKKGDLMQEIQYRNQEQTFNCVVTVESLPTGDVLVIDNVAENVRRVICIDNSGNSKYTWNGQVGSRKVGNFWLSRMTHDDRKVYITDRKNHCIYVLDNCGNAEQFMLNKLGVTTPAAISIDSSGKLWLGCESKIFVLE